MTNLTHQKGLWHMNLFTTHLLYAHLGAMYSNRLNLNVTGILYLVTTQVISAWLSLCRRNRRWCCAQRQLWLVFCGQWLNYSTKVADPCFPEKEQHGWRLCRRVYQLSPSIAHWHQIIHRTVRIPCLTVVDPNRKVPDLYFKVVDPKLQVADLKSELGELRSGGIPNLTTVCGR